MNEHPYTGEKMETVRATEVRAEGYSGWAVVEIMGHRRVAGLVQPAVQYGSAGILVRIPGAGDICLTCLGASMVRASVSYGTRKKCDACNGTGVAAKPDAEWVGQQFYAGPSIFCVTPTEESAVRREAAFRRQQENRGPVVLALPEPQAPTDDGLPEAVAEYAAFQRAEDVEPRAAVIAVGLEPTDLNVRRAKVALDRMNA